MADATGKATPAADDITTRARALAEAMLHNSKGAGRLSEVADAVLTLVAVGDGPTRAEWDDCELPRWAAEWPEGRGNALPTALARLVAQQPETHLAAISPGARHELAAAVAEMGGDDYIYLDHHAVLTREMYCDLMRRDGVPGDHVRLTDLGREVARLLAEGGA